MNLESEAEQTNKTDGWKTKTKKSDVNERMNEQTFTTFRLKAPTISDVFIGKESIQ